MRERLKGSEPVILVGAHSALSAKLVEEAGFDGVWVSGFEVSASYGIPDANLLTMTENMEVAKQINGGIGIPVIADCDNGYGNVINVIRTVEGYEGIGLGGICIEDNIFPKRCSFYVGVKRELASIEEHVGKIRAAKSRQVDGDFMVIARTEALIAGWGLEEAYRRALAYAEAGADAILLHSKDKDVRQLENFSKMWDHRVPLVAVPTIYKEATAGELYDLGYKIIIFANHGLRASIKAMRKVFSVLKRELKASSVDGEIVSLEEVYGLVGVKEMKEDEDLFLPVGAEKITAIILAAGFEKELLPLIEEKPKTMLDIKGKSILERQVNCFNQLNIKDIVVVRGYQKEKIDLPNIRYYDNDDYEKTYILHSLFLAQEEMKDRVVVSYGDILFEEVVLQKLLKSEYDITLVVDRAFLEGYKSLSESEVVDMELVECEGEGQGIQRIGKGGIIIPEKAYGEFIGLAMFSQNGINILKQTYRSIQYSKHKNQPFHTSQSFNTACFTDLIQEIVQQGHHVKAVEIYKGWLEINTFEDYKKSWIYTPS